jgi:hypothetical protein
MRDNDMKNARKPILEKEEHLELQQDRTRNGLCARCAEQAAEHVNGQCLDGKGSFTWCHDREDMCQIIQGLEGFLGRARKPATVVTDADRVCSILYCASAGRLPAWAPSETEYLAALSAASEYPVDKSAALSLIEKLVQFGPRFLPNLNIPKIIGVLCGWSHARTQIAIEAARDAGYIRGGRPLPSS